MQEKNKMDERHSFQLDHVHLRPEQQIALHQQPTWELSYIVCGEGERTIGSIREPFRSGEIALIVPQMPHCWQFDPTKTDAEGRIENITITFPTELLDTTGHSFPETQSIIEQLKALPNSILFVRHTAQRMAALLKEMPSQPTSVQLFMLLQVIMLMAQSNEHKVIGRFNLSPTEQRLRNIETFLTCNYKRPITLSDLAQYASMNQTALCKFLKQHLGKTFTQCLTDRRMAEARNLLSHTGLTVSEVCYRSGFNDVPHFCRVFKQQEGMTPKEYQVKCSFKASI